MMKCNITLSISPEIISKFDSLELQRSQFVEECMLKEYERIQKIKPKDSEIPKCLFCGVPLSNEKIIKIGENCLCKSCFLAGNNQKLWDLHQKQG